jgi:peroxiredoxin
MNIIEIGQTVPQFSLKDQHGEMTNIEDSRGKRVILSFHPLAFTKVCTRQMQDLEKHRETFEKHGAIAYGLSVDSVPCKHAWAKDIGVKETLLLADFWPHGGVAKQLGLFREDDGFSERAVILLDEQGIVRFTKVYPIGEVPDMGEILEQLKKLDS